MHFRRRLGSTDLSVSPLGLACNFGIDADVVESALHEHDINYFFVTSRADAGVDGVKKLIAGGRRNDIVIATGANVPFGWSVRREWEKSARSLGVDCIDVFHLFWVQAHWYVTGNTWREMVKLKEEGKVRALAISCHDRPLASQLATELALDVLMIRYNAAHRGAENEIFSNFTERRPAVVAYTATRWGRLLKPAAGIDPMTPPECYRFAISNPNVDVVLCGPKSKEELAQDRAGVALGPLPSERLESVRRFGDAVRSSVTGKIGFGAA
jgi:aryl-alcohol dehydrogenase-like predicted oxidoreductase